MSRSSSVRNPRQTRDTGFPEPFCSVRNTTLPHPEADLSPHACIGQDDVHADLVMKRRNLSFLHRHKKHKKTLSHGVVAGATTSTLSLAPSTSTAQKQRQASHESAAQFGHHDNNSQPSIIETGPSPTASKYARDSFATSRRDEDEDETPPTSPDEASMKSSRRLFGKFRRHH